MSRTDLGLGLSVLVRSRDHDKQAQPPLPLRHAGQHVPTLELNEATECRVAWCSLNDFAGSALKLGISLPEWLEPYKLRVAQ